MQIRAIASPVRYRSGCGKPNNPQFQRNPFFETVFVFSTFTILKKYFVKFKETVGQFK